MINSSMYRPDDRSIGLLAHGDEVNNGRDNKMLGGYFFFDPTDPADAPVTFAGRGCPGVDVAALRGRYRGVVQNYRLMGCSGEPLPWADDDAFSAAAIALDSDGNVVWIHARRAHAMTELGKRLADPAFELVAAHYVEGGPEASLFVSAGDLEVAEVGALESPWDHAHDNRTFWSIPNVIGIERR